MEITLSNYTENALLTNQREYVPLWERLGKTGNPDVQIVDLYHGALGVVTEAGELCDGQKKGIFYGKFDRVNIVEEIGDCFWYLAIMSNAGGVDLSYLVTQAVQVTAKLPTRMPSLCAKLAYSSGAMFAAADRGMYQPNGLLWVDLELHAVACTAVLLGMLDMVGVSLDTCLATNIEKLVKIRYKNQGFTAENANVRDTSAERVVLEKGVSQ